jgi:hypothetical protein
MKVTGFPFEAGPAEKKWLPLLKWSYLHLLRKMVLFVSLIN